jgi:PAS domain S-box-containing protein
MAQHASDSIVITHEDGVMVWANSAFAAKVGLEPEALVGRPIMDFDTRAMDQDALQRIYHAVKERRPIREQLRLHRSGALVWHDVTITPVADAGGVEDCFVTVERDISEQKAHEAELARARKAAEAAAEAKSSFLATMSHEIRTPMNGIIGTADLLGETALDEDQARLLRTISLSSEALLRIINDILDLSKLEAGRMDVEAVPFEPADLVATSAQLLRPLAERKGLALDVATGPGAEAVLSGDPGRMRQILLNLLGNAIKFTEAGRVTLAVVVEPAGPDARRLTLEVTDTGIGIAPDRLGGVFDAFTQADGSITRRFGGTGLGLTICRRLAEAMGGRMEVRSRLGEGSTFSLSLTLPLADEPAPAMTLIEGAAPADPTPPAGELSVVGGEGEGPLVLVVEDNATNRFLVERMLSGRSLRMAHAEDGAQGVAACARLDPDIVLMDMSMPVMDGIEATRLIREAERRDGRAARPILALTANAATADRDRGAEAGVTRFLTKPIRKAELRAAVAEALDLDRDERRRTAP